MTAIDFGHLSHRNRKYPKKIVALANGAKFSVLNLPKAEKNELEISSTCMFIAKTESATLVLRSWQRGTDGL